MEIARNRLVHIEYTLHDADGIHLNPNEGELIYLHGGYGHIFSELENALDGKVVDDTFKVTLSPQEAFGEFEEELLFTEELSELPEDIYVGMELDGDSDELSEKNIIYTIMNINDEYATLNGNHPLAGKTLTFEGLITEIQELNEDEVQAILEHDTHHHD
ncbi:peptidylprolyl isomerase, FKBP-type [Sulfurimonas gotlandica GD1]|jgi:FKBP-type peptidyl-prolyl cis-trans isomerase SlyD|uniref:peptidylprolyl isomerase n=1 Tax=Sulfurimonas gotlandica (strain DSM 19862 / JCM 16533 / GD1) TaxID=929558 RepID=B6BHK4_SULGG|nr:peptidylprolyl isomerase [Sulfurimonas gotlandica]EDZ63383.1 fkbp-type peptidyl-prolyl cis-trans isomerase [Sulfurimonas gotlandica GD1]EHP30002.1 peptidylprolyl isomerase, FKBP-type [Sulfurimonas gotlandica GD1]